MKTTLWQYLPGLTAAALLFHASSCGAGTTYTYTDLQPRTGGSWTNTFSFPQFNPAWGSLDSVHLTATFDLSTSGTVVNTDQSSKVFWVQGGSMLQVTLPGELGLMEGSAFGPRVHYKLSGFGSDSYGPFNAEVTLDLTLSSEDVGSFLGTGTVELPACAQLQEIVQSLDGGGNKIDVNLASTSGAVFTLQYLDSPVPEPSTGALLALALGALALRRRNGRHG